MSRKDVIYSKYKTLKSLIHIINGSSPREIKA